MTQKDIAIVIVLYNDIPKDYIYLYNDLKFIVVDNTPNRDLALEGSNITYIPLGENLGIAKALNEGFKKAKELKLSWVLTMDQDSELPSNMIDEYIKYINKGHSNIGILSPLISVFKGDIKKTSEEVNEINEALTSGSLINIKAYNVTGGFKDELFIDSVDFEFCWNVKLHGYKIYQLNNVLMQHQLGESFEINFFGFHLMYVTNHNYIRRYYMTRNSLYVDQLYQDIMPKNKYKSIRQFITIVKIILFEKDKIRKIKAIKQGKKDFKNNKFGKFNDSL